jgi:hypothetical protein
MDAFGGIKGEVGDALAQAYRLTISKLEDTGTLTRQEKEIVALRLVALARQGVKRPELLSEAAIELLRRKRSRAKPASRRFVDPNGTAVRSRR